MLLGDAATSIRLLYTAMCIGDKIICDRGNPARNCFVKVFFVFIFIIILIDLLMFTNFLFRKYKVLVDVPITLL